MSNVTQFPKNASGTGSDGGGGKLEARVERLENDVSELKADMKAIRSDLSEIKGQIKAMPSSVQLLGFILAVLVASGLLKHFG